MSSSAEHRPLFNVSPSLIVRNPIVVSPNTDILVAIALMDSAADALPHSDVERAGNLAAQRLRASCVLVVSEGRYVGLFTERDVVRLVTQRRPFDTLRVQQVMDSADVALCESTSAALSWRSDCDELAVASRLKYPCLPVLNAEDFPIGLVSGETLQRCIKSSETTLHQTAEALQQSEQANRAIVNAMPDLLIQMDRQGNYRHFAGGTAVQVEPLPEPIDQQTVHVGLSPELAQQRLDYASRALDTGTLQIYEQTFDQDGDLRHEEVRVTPLSAQHVLIIIRDITERKRAEAQLQNLIAGTAATTGQDFFPALVYHISQTLEASHVAVSEQVGQQMHTLARCIDGTRLPNFAYDIADTPCEQILRNGSFYCENHIQQAFPEDTALVEIGARSCLGVALSNSAGEAIGTLCIFDRQPIKKPARAEQILRVFAARASAELERQRALVSLEQLNQQLETRVKERTTELLLQKQFLQTVLDTLPAPVFWIDRHSTYLGCNQPFASVNGLDSPTDLVGRSVMDVVRVRSEAEEFIANNQQVIETGRPEVGIQERYTTPDGEQRMLETSKAPLMGLDDNVIGIVITFQDVTERKRAESALRDSEQRFRNAIANAPFPIMMHAEDGEVIQLSATWTDITGYRQDDIPTVAAWAHLAHGDRAPAILDSIRKTYSLPGRRDGGELEITTRDASQRVWQITCAPLAPLPDGRRLTMTMAVDVTERRQAEQALRESEERYRNIYNQAAMGLISFSAEGRVIDANPSFCEMLGYFREEIRSKTAPELTYSGDHAEFFSAVERLFTSGEQALFKEKRCLRKDGSTLWVGATVSIVRDPSGQIKHALGIVQDISEKKRYEAEREQAEAKVHALLRRSELLNRISSEIRASLELDTILHNLVNAVVTELPVDSCTFGWYIHTKDSGELDRVEVIREKKVDGLESCIGTYYSNQYPQLFESIQTNRMFRADEVLASSDMALAEHLRRVRLSTYLCLPVHTAGGRIALLHLGRIAADQPWADEEISLFESIANQVAIAIYQAQLYEESQAKTQELERSYRELQEAQIHMVQAEKMSSLGQLVAGIAHEINNPVGFISGNLAVAENYVNTLATLVERYQQAYPQPPQAIAQLSAQADVGYILTDFPKLLTSMENGATRIQAIVQSLRTFSRLEQVGQSAVNINQRIENTLVILQNRLNGRAGTPEVEVVKHYGDLPEIECYGSLLDQVFINLLVNAIDAIEERQAAANSGYSGRILITTAIADSSVLISIKDNGVGMDAETQANIFNPFFTTKPTGVGTGMGLSISYQIVTGSHNGRLYCRSIPGEGTEFVVDIPRRLG